MNPLLQWFASAEWVQIVTALLHSLWQGALIALMLALFLRRISNPVLRYRLSLAALVGVMLAGILTWAVLNTSERNGSSSPPNLPSTQSQAAHSEVPSLPSNTDKIIVTTQRLPPAPAFRWTGWLALIWLTGAGLMLVRTSVKVAGAGQLRRSCRPLDDARIEKLLAEARHAVGLMRQVRIGVTNRLTSPAVVGVFVPMLVLPLSLLSTLTPEQIRFVLLHELAHIRRGDYLANLFQFFVESLLFFNPAIWWISHQVRREREACCDALAIALSGAPADYARTLVHVAENVLQPASVAAPAFDNQRDPSSLLERVHRLLVPGYRPSLRLTWRAMLAGLTLGSALLILSAVGTRTTVAAILSAENPATNSWPDPHFSGYEAIDLQPRFLIVDESRLRAALPGMTPGSPLGIPSEKFADVQRKLGEAGAVSYNSAQQIGFQVFSGGFFHVQIGGCSNCLVNYSLEQRGTKPLIVGANAQLPATQANWSQMDLFWTPWKEQGGVRSEMKLAFDGNTNVTQAAETTIPSNGAMVWAVKSASNPGKCQIILLQPAYADKTISTPSITSETQSSGAQPAETKPQLDAAQDQLQALAIKLGMPHDMAEAAMQIDAVTLEKMFQSESLQKYLPFADKKRELNGLERDRKMLEMKMLSTKADAQDASSEQNIPDAQTIRMLEADRDYQLPEYIKAKAYFDAISARYHISEPVDFSKITEKNFNDYAQYYTARLAYEQRVAFGRILANKITSLKRENAQPSTNFDYSNVAWKTNVESLSNLVNDRILGNTNRFNMFRAETKWTYQSEAAAQKSSSPAAANRLNIEDKLEDIHLPQISLNNSKLSDVLLSLNEDSKRYDPNKIGINFIASYGLTNATVTVRPNQQDVSLKDALIDIIAGSTTPIRYTIEDHEVVFYQDNTTNALLVRWFKVDPYVLAKKFNVQLETDRTNKFLVLVTDMREFFQQAGIDLQRPKALFYNDKNGVLVVRATAKDLDVMETIIQQWNYSPPRITIKTTFISVPDDLAKSLLKNIATGSNGTPTGGFEAMLFPGEARRFRELCDQTPGVNIYGGPEVTTASGRKAQILVDVEAMTLVKGVKPEALVPPGLTNEMFYQTEQFYTGPTVDLVPTVSADEYTIQLSAIPKITEFLGYDGGKTNTAKYHVYVNGKKESVTLSNPRPHTRTRTMAANATLLDGQSLLLGGAPWVESITKADGTVETKTTKDTSNKQLFVLVTPILVDPTGNRIHTGEEMKEFSDARRESP